MQIVFNFEAASVEVLLPIAANLGKVIVNSTIKYVGYRIEGCEVRKLQRNQKPSAESHLTVRDCSSALKTY